VSKRKRGAVDSGEVVMSGGLGLGAPPRGKKLKPSAPAGFSFPATGSGAGRRVSTGFSPSGVSSSGIGAATGSPGAAGFSLAPAVPASTAKASSDRESSSSPGLSEIEVLSSAPAPRPEPGSAVPVGFLRDESANRQVEMLLLDESGYYQHPVLDKIENSDIRVFAVWTSENELVFEARPLSGNYKPVDLRQYRNSLDEYMAQSNRSVLVDMEKDICFVTRWGKKYKETHKHWAARLQRELRAELLKPLWCRG